MNKEFSAGALIFRKEGDSVLFLLVYSLRNKIWGFPKGHMEAGEAEKDTAKREIKEETCLEEISFIEGFREEIIYTTISKKPPFKGQPIEKHSIYYLCQANTDFIQVDNKEISDYRWLTAKDADKLLLFENLKNILKKAQTKLLNL